MLSYSLAKMLGKSETWKPNWTKRQSKADCETEYNKMVLEGSKIIFFFLLKIMRAYQQQKRRQTPWVALLHLQFSLPVPWCFLCGFALTPEWSSRSIWLRIWKKVPVTNVVQIQMMSPQPQDWFKSIMTAMLHEIYFEICFGMSYSV